MRVAINTGMENNTIRQVKCELCNRKATWRVYHGIYEERESTGHPVCRQHALKDKNLTAIEPN